ncbi:MAG: ATP-binding protein [Actinobacteria bacterium]|nr:ATP-binding protein [Actinomycetota bacterium]
MDLRRRNVSAFAREVLDAMPCTVIQGARQVGKSTLAQQLAAERPSISYTMDDPDVRAAARSDPRAFLDQAADRMLVIDEIQRAPELILPLKAAIDRDRRSGRFLLTGSSDLLRFQGTPDSLAGRALSVPLYGFSQGERRDRVDDFASAVHAGGHRETLGTSAGRDEIAAIIVAGGYPSAPVSERLRIPWFEGYLERMLRVDATDIRRGASSERLDALVRLIAANQSGELVKARLARDAGVPETSVSRSLDALGALYLTLALRPWTPNLTTREASKPKLQIADTGLAAALVRTPASLLADPVRGSALLGPLLESFVVSELAKQRTWTASPFEMYHWRDRDGREVDVVLEFDDGGVLGIEVKSSSTPRAEHFAGLRALSDKLGDRFVGGIVLGLGEKSLPFGPALYSLPVSSLWDLVP